MSSNRSVFGVDFSGAQDAGRKIWIASGTLEDGRLHITNCLQAKDLYGSDTERDAAISALRSFIATQNESVFGLDFPFSLATEMIGYSTWQDFALSFAADYPDSTDLRKAGDATSAKHNRAIKRQTDYTAKTPFTPYNIRLFRQTYHGIRDLLAPLVRDNRVCVLPMQEPELGKPWVIEICPASTLKRRGLYPSYKGKTASHRLNRTHILATLQEWGIIVPQAIHRQLLDDTEGDALDSVIAAFATVQALQNNFHTPGEPCYRVEGFVYGC